MLIDASYFAAGPRQIRNATLGKGTTEERAVIEQYIADYQREFLCRAVGGRAGDAVQSYLHDLDTDAYAARDEEIEEVCAKLRKPFADYVLFHVLRDSGQTATITGVVRLKSANTYVEPITRQVTAWNRMSNALNLFAEWVDGGECPLPGVEIDKHLLEPINRFNL